MNNVDEFVYRVFKEPEFYRFKKYKFFEGNKLDKDSGFIHLSTNDQINGTIQKYFCDEKNVIIVEFFISDLENYILWEEGRGKHIFPHYYGKLKFQWVRNYYEKLFYEL